MLVIKPKYQKRKYIVGRGLACISPIQTKYECCNTGITISEPQDVSNPVALKALSKKSKELLEGLKKNS
jgi:hypothetical protein